MLPLGQCLLGQAASYTPNVQTVMVSGKLPSDCTVLPGVLPLACYSKSYRLSAYQLPSYQRSSTLALGTCKCHSTLGYSESRSRKRQLPAATRISTSTQYQPNGTWLRQASPEVLGTTQDATLTTVGRHIRPGLFVSKTERSLEAWVHTHSRWIESLMITFLPNSAIPRTLLLDSFSHLHRRVQRVFLIASPSHLAIVVTVWPLAQRPAASGQTPARSAKVSRLSLCLRRNLPLDLYPGAIRLVSPISAAATIQSVGTACVTEAREQVQRGTPVQSRGGEGIAQHA